MSTTYEVNFDGLIGPTHNYAGLAFGNLASDRNAHRVSRPKQAALQGLKKMRILVNQGYKQGFLLPQQRPDIPFLRRLGFRGSDHRILTKLCAQAPDLLAMVYSASSMWAANAATVTASRDSGDGKLHFTPANLQTTAHRAIEQQATYRCLETIFNNRDNTSEFFSLHPALPPHSRFADEGAANHTRLCEDYSKEGVSLFVYGRDTSDPCYSNGQYPARQTLEASRAIARQHQAKTAVFLAQHDAAIAAGAFHNDVVAVGNGPVLLFHEQAFKARSQEAAFAALSQFFSASTTGFQPLCIPSSRISLDDAVSNYLFNSQLLSSPDGNMQNMRLLAPTEAENHPATRDYLNELIEDPANPIHRVDFVDVRQSMCNGGGPACLRLRVVMNEAELNAVHPGFLLDNAAIDRLEAWVEKHYRETLSFGELTDPQLVDECYKALDELTRLLDIGAFYPFQQ